MEYLKEKIKSKKFQNIAYGVCAVVLVGWVVFRFAAIGSENARAVFNTARSAADVGAPVYAIQVKNEPGTLREPIAVRDNRALVSAARVGRFQAGQNVGDGEIVSVSHNVDLNTGMYIVHTRDVDDGLQYALYQSDGYFIPLSAIYGNTVMLAVDGVATPRSITVVRQDAENAQVAGLNDGDVVILSHVDAGAKVQIKE